MSEWTLLGHAPLSAWQIGLFPFRVFPFTEISTELKRRTLGIFIPLPFFSFFSFLRRDKLVSLVGTARRPAMTLVSHEVSVRLRSGRRPERAGCCNALPLCRCQSGTERLGIPAIVPWHLIHHLLAIKTSQSEHWIQRRVSRIILKVRVATLE